MSDTFDSELAGAVSDDAELVCRRPFDDLVAEIGADDALEAYQAFVDDAVERLDRLQAIVTPGRNVVKVDAHSLKSTAATFGFDRMSKLARRLESEADQLEVASYNALLADLRQAFENGLAQFDALKQAA